MNNNKKESKYLSASRIKTLQSCSWLYWCNYILKMPDKKNDGSSRGTICHLIFEVLGNKRHKKHFNKIMKTQDVFSVESIKRLIIKHAKILEVDDFENIALIKQMIFNGLSYDFLAKNSEHPQNLSRSVNSLLSLMMMIITSRLEGLLISYFFTTKRNTQ